MGGDRVDRMWEEKKISSVLPFLADGVPEVWRRSAANENVGRVF